MIPQFVADLVWVFFYLFTFFIYLTILSVQHLNIIDILLYYGLLVNWHVLHKYSSAVIILKSTIVHEVKHDWKPGTQTNLLIKRRIIIIGLRMDFSLDKSLSYGLQDCECAWESHVTSTIRKWLHIKQTIYTDRSYELHKLFYWLLAVYKTENLILVARIYFFVVKRLKAFRLYSGKSRSPWCWKCGCQLAAPHILAYPHRVKHHWHCITELDISTTGQQPEHFLFNFKYSLYTCGLCYWLNIEL